MRYHQDMNISHAVAYATKQLQQTITDPTLRNQYAWWLLEKITNKSKTMLMVNQSHELSEADKTLLDTYLHQIVHEHKPIQYILGFVPFADLDILVEPPILIPRPETEEWAINLIIQLKNLPHQNLRILDLCTGSGCIALALAHALPEAHVWGIDISKEAIALAQRNARHNDITNCTFIESDLFANVPRDLTFDIIVSNPPYIAHNEASLLDASVTEWEDSRALFASDNGLSIITQIVTHAPHYLHNNSALHELTIPSLTLEIGHQQGHAVKEILECAGYEQVHIIPDMAHKDRIVVGTFHDRHTPQS